MTKLGLLMSTIVAVPLTVMSDPPAWADAAPDPQAQTPSLQEIVVTARHREENLQSVPLAVSVVDGDLAQKDNRNDVQDLVAILPSVNFRNQQSNKDRDILIRGLGTISTSAGAEATVSTVMDGVVLLRPGQMTADILDLDQVEVLRGPQGTLFGKNSSAGVISITTKNPTFDYHGYGDIQYYEGNEVRLATGLSGPVIENKLAASISGLYSDYDGNVKNLDSGRDVNGYAHDGLHSKWLFTPTDNFTLLVGGDYLHSRDTVAPYVYIATGRVAYPTNAVTPNPKLAALLSQEGIDPIYGNRTISNNSLTNTRDDTYGSVIQADYLFSGFDLTSISAYRGWRNVQTVDLSGLGALVSAFPQEDDVGHVREHQYTEEVRLASPKGHLLDYVVGAFYMNAPDDETYMRTTTQLSTSNVATVNEGFNHFGAHFNNASGFGEGDLNITDNFRLIAGFRFIHDELSYYSHRISTSAVAVPGTGPSFGDGGEISKNGEAARAGWQYDVTSDINAYFTYSRGYKGPAYNVFYNMALTNTNVLKPETSNSFELGAKATLFDKKLRLDAALFDDTVHDYQANVPAVIDGTTVTDLINAGTVGTEGVEIDATALITDRLSITPSFAYDFARIIGFNCPPNSPSSCNVNGQPLPFTPKIKFDLRGDYVAYSDSRYDVTLDSDYSFQTKVQFQLTQTPDTIQQDYGIWNARVTLTDKPNDWEGSVIVKNIMNQHYYSYIGAGGVAGLTGIVPRDFDRYFGVNIHKSF